MEIYNHRNTPDTWPELQNYAVANLIEMDIYRFVAFLVENC
jgi:hypothetical protein